MASALDEKCLGACWQNERNLVRANATVQRRKHRALVTKRPMARLFILLGLALFIVQVRNGMHGSPLLAKAEQENKR